MTTTGDEGDTVYLSALPDGGIRILAGTSAVIWSEATSAETSASLVERVAGRVGLPPEVVGSDVEAFVTQLLQMGLIRAC